MKLKKKKVSIIGAGHSGVAAAKLLSALEAQVWITDNSDEEKIKDNIKKLSALENIRIETGKHSEEFVDNSRLIVVSPGVKNDAEPIKWALRKKIPIISEIELGFLFSPAKIIAITGSNGKTTVSSLTTEILKHQGLNAFALGNMGNPFCDYILSLTKSDIVVLEVSTFQLEWINKFRPYISAILNISPNHLDRHKDIQEYVELKKKIFLNQRGDDVVVLNSDDPVVKEFAWQVKAKVEYFGDKKFNANYAAAMKIASVFDIDASACFDIFNNFKGIEHRLEYVDTINGVDFINDSKSTTVHATIWALKNIKKPTILIAGGRDKGLDFRQLRPFIKGCLKKIILIGEAQQLIEDALGDIITVRKEDSLGDAVNTAISLSSQGDCILLSPMCASFDMFKDFQDRGKVFKDIVAAKIKNT